MSDATTFPDVTSDASKHAGAPSTDSVGGIAAINWFGQCLARRELLPGVGRQEAARAFGYRQLLDFA